MQCFPPSFPSAQVLHVSLLSLSPSTFSIPLTQYGCTVPVHWRKKMRNGNHRKSQGTRYLRQQWICHSVTCLPDEKALQQQIPGTETVSAGEQWELCTGQI